MKLPNVLSSFIPQKKIIPKTYLALELLDTGVKVLAWEILGEKISLLSQTASQFRSDEEEEKIRVCDQAISLVEEQLPAGLVLKDVVLGLTEKMVTKDSKIVSSVSSFLHKLCQELSLTPVGFVVINEAIVNYLKKEEGAPVTVILVNLNDNNLSCALVRGGRVEQVLFQSEVTNVAEALVLIFKQFNAEALPSRILLYDFSSNLEPVRQELISYPWLSKANFLHFPKLEILSDNQDLKAIAYSGSFELLAKEVKFEETTDNSKPGFGEALTDKQSAGVYQDDGGQAKNKQADGNRERKTAETPEVHGQEEKPALSDNIEEFGFVKDQDILEVRSKEQSFEAEAFKEEAFAQKPISKSQPEEKIEPEEKTVRAGTKKLSWPKIDIQKILNFLSPQKISWPRFSFLALNFNSNGPLIITSLLAVVILALLLSGFWFLPKASVTIMVSPKTMDKQTEVLIATGSGQITADNAHTLSGQTVNISEETSANASATGKKLIGDKAKGQVTIYNKTEVPKTFSKGTVMETSSGLQFSLDSDVQVASTSAFATSFSSVTANVTALQIGTDSNLAFGTNFTFADFPASSFIAKNDNAFTGGTSKQVQAVSQEDQDKLLSDLTGQLLDKAKKDLAAANNQSQSLINDTLQKNVVKKTFSVPVGTETQQFSLSLKMNFTALSYQQSQMKEILKKIIAPDIPQGYVFTAKNSTVAASVKKVQKDGTVVLNVELKASLLPDIDLAKAQKQLAGKSLADGKKYLLGLTGISEVKPVFSPVLPGFLLSFPHVAKNINLQIMSQQSL